MQVVFSSFGQETEQITNGANHDFQRILFIAFDKYRSLLW